MNPDFFSEQILLSTDYRNSFVEAQFIRFTGPPLNGKDIEQPEESPSRPIRAVRSRQNTLEEILVRLLFSLPFATVVAER